jgi:hypothetical protein
MDSKRINIVGSSRFGFLKYWLGVLVLLALIVLLNIAYNALSAQRVVMTGVAGEVLYAAGFDGFNDEWQSYDGRLSAQVTEGHLAISTDELASTPFSLANPQFGDFDLTVQMTASAGLEDNGMGVIFRLQDNANACDKPLKILCDLAEIDLLSIPINLIFRPQNTTSTGYYYFMISSDGYYALFKGESVGSTIQARKISTWISSDTINTGIGNMNTLRVLAIGNTFQFYVNGNLMPLCIPNNPEAESTYNYLTGECLEGQMLTTFVDDSYASGRIGMIVRSPETLPRNATFTPTTIEFDNLTIKSPARNEVEA